MPPTNLRELIQSHASSVFLGSFAEEIVYTPIGGDAKTIRATVQRLENVMSDGVSDGRDIEHRYVVQIATDETLGVAAPREGDSVGIDGITAKVQGSSKRSGLGLQVIEAVWVEEYEKSAENYRRP